MINYKIFYIYYKSKIFFIIFTLNFFSSFFINIDCNNDEIHDDVAEIFALL